MAMKVFNEYRIKRSNSTAKAMKKLVESKIFTQYKDIIMISAVIGYNYNRYVEFEDNAESVQMTFFNERDYDVIDLIVFSDKREQTILKEKEKYKIFESYANGGFPILLERLDLKNIESMDVSEDETRTAQKKYYSLLLSDGFIPKKAKVTGDDLFI
ncbi:MAG: hypothetical protein RR646_06790 [Erysipelotrichaceae bacterium]